MNYLQTLLLCFLLFPTLGPEAAHAQMPRERADVPRTVEDAFWAPALITQTTTSHLPAGNLNVTIMHSFGIATEDAIRDFFGFDNVQNVRLGLDIGLTDRWSAGIGRSSLLNVVDLRTKYAILKQNESDSRPVSLSLKGDVGVVTQENRRPFEDDISMLGSVILSRKFSKTVSLQVAPQYAYFSRLGEIGKRELFSVGIGSSIRLSNRYALTAEYYPVLAGKIAETMNAFSLGLNIQTGGHVFQLFFTSTEWHLEQYVVANNDHRFWAGDFRFGFNVNRVFSIGGR